jgi:hydroxyacyl-ACP dehydratase HTD2-like protein with hotdog domain
MPSQSLLDLVKQIVPTEIRRIAQRLLVNVFAFQTIGINVAQLSTIANIVVSFGCGVQRAE